MPEWTKEDFQLFVLDREVLAESSGDFEDPMRRQAYLVDAVVKGSIILVISLSSG